MKKIIIFLMMAFFIGNITALDILAGENYTFNLEKPYAYYSIAGNSTSLDGINITQNGFDVIITLDKYLKSDSFEITFYSEEEEVISPSSSGHHHKKRIGVINKTELVSSGNETTETVPEIPPINLPPKDFKSNFLWLILIGLIILGIILIIVLIKRHNKDVRRSNGNNKKRKERIEEKEEKK